MDKIIKKNKQIDICYICIIIACPACAAHLLLENISTAKTYSQLIKVANKKLTFLGIHHKTHKLE